jgi:hypothetical protein
VVGGYYTQVHRKSSEKNLFWWIEKAYRWKLGIKAGGRSLFPTNISFLLRAAL